MSSSYKISTIFIQVNYISTDLLYLQENLILALFKFYSLLIILFL